MNWKEIEMCIEWGGNPSFFFPNILQNCSEVTKNQRFLKKKKKKEISNKSCTESKCTVYVETLKITLNDFYTTPSSGIFVMFIWKFKLKIIQGSPWKTDTILLNHISASPG